MRLSFALTGLLVGCGRIAFDPLAGGGASDDAGGGDANRDGDGGDTGDPSLLLHYKFDDLPGDGVLDSSGHGHTATCPSGCPGQGSTAKFGAAYIFNGANTMLVTPDAADLRPAEITITAWVYLRSGGLQGLVQRPFGSATENAWQLAIAGGGGFWTCAVAGCSQPSPPLTLTTWHHVALVATATVQEAYLDGASIDSFASTLMWDANPILIGADRDNGVDVAFVDGNIDDLRIYNRALDAATIAALAAQ